MSSDPNQSNISHSYIAAVYRDSGILESLGHSAAFARVVDENIVETSSSLRCGQIALERYEVPVEMVETHGFPTSFEISNFNGELIKLPVDDVDSAKDEKAPWAFNANYDIGNRHFTLCASDKMETSRLHTVNDEGGELAYDIGPGSATRLLTAIALRVLYNRAIVPEEGLPKTGNDSPEKIAELLYTIGNLHGAHSSQKKALLEAPEIGRAVLIDFTETETPSSSGISVNYRMVWEFGNNLQLLTEMRSHQEETMSALTNGDPLATRFAERCPSLIKPDELAYCQDSNDTAEFKTQLFDSTSPTAGYETVNTAILAIVGKFMEPYARLDKDPQIVTERSYLDEYPFDAPDAG